MKMKKFWSMVFALAIAVNLSAVAFATDTTINKVGTHTVIVNSTVNLPTINVTVDTVPDIIVNPYHLEITPGKNDDDGIISKPVKITSTSTIGLAVSATPTGTCSAGSTTFESALADVKDKKAVFMFLQLIADVTGTGTDGAVEEGDLAGLGWKAIDADRSDGTCAVVTAADAASHNTATIDMKKPASGGKTYAAFKFIGECGSPAADSDNQWTNNDAVSLSVAFTFTPKDVAP